MKRHETARNRAAWRALVLVICLGFSSLGIPASGAEKNTGARVSVQSKDGRAVEGELVAVKGRSLVLADSVMMTSAEIAVEDIVRIRIVRKSRVFSGLGIGVLAGAASGALLGFLSGDDPKRGFWTNWMSFTASEKAGIFAISLGAVGGSIGALVGGIKGADQNIEWASLPPADRGRALRKLRAISRFPNEYAGPATSLFRGRS
jgi:hypothetical protein